MKLHLVNDEKIINRTIGEFEAVWPGQNLWVVANRKRKSKLVDNGPNVICREEFLRSRSAAHYDEIYIHLLNPRKIKILKKLDLRRSRIYWIIWGLDLYNKLLVPEGFQLYTPDNSIRRLRRISEFFKRIGARREARNTVRFIGDHVDYIVTDTTENDYQYLVNYYPQLKQKPWKDFFYYPIDAILNPTLMKAEVTGNDIMVGNSASATNNHEHVFELLGKLDLNGRRVVVPLSYSGRKEYVDAVLRKGRETLGESFQPLMEFMPLEDYNVQQARTSVAIFGNLRQEAVGNIIIALYLGAKVFLPKSNPVNGWARSHGLVIRDLEELTQHELDEPLDESARLANRTILTGLYTRTRLRTLIAQLPVL